MDSRQTKHRDEHEGDATHNHMPEHHHPKKGEIEVYVHEGATIASGVFTFEIEYQRIINPIKAQLEEIAQWVDKEGGLIGHIKAYLKRGESGALLSITDFDEKISVKHSMSQSVEVSMAAIVYNITPERLQTRIINMVNSIKKMENGN